MCDKFEVGDFFSTDQFVCKTPGCLPTGYGSKSRDHRYQGGTIYNYTASCLIWVENKVSIGSNETVVGKSRFEQWLWDEAAAKVSHYHINNGIFTATYYLQDYKEKGLTQSF